MKTLFDRPETPRAPLARSVCVPESFGGHFSEMPRGIVTIEQCHHSRSAIDSNELSCRSSSLAVSFFALTIDQLKVAKYTQLPQNFCGIGRRKHAG
jgi:hypothetical protein